MANFKKLIIVIICLIGFGFAAQSQTFHGFQTPSQKGMFFSLVWSGETQLGVGYSYRFFNTTPSIVQAELRFPFSDGFQWNNFKAIGGVYRTPLNSRFFFGYGGHVRYTQNFNGSAKTSKIQFAATALPSYTYLYSLTDKPYSTAGVRMTYVPTIWNKDANGSTSWFGEHMVELGAHVDFHLQRSLFTAINATRSFILDDSGEAFNNLDIYAGSIYRSPN